LNAVKNGSFDFNVEKGTFEQLVEWLNKSLSGKVAEFNDVELGDILNDADTKTRIEEYRKKLSSLTSAIEKYQSDGQITSSEKVDLFELFPDLKDVD